MTHTFGTTCVGCGPVAVPAHDVILHLCDQIDLSFYEFDCPACTLTTYRQATPEQAAEIAPHVHVTGWCRTGAPAFTAVDMTSQVRDLKHELEKL